MASGKGNAMREPTIRMGLPAAVVMLAAMGAGCDYAGEAVEIASRDEEGLLRWSAADNGLAARIEGFTESHLGSRLFVRVRNVSSRPLVVPLGRPLGEQKRPGRGWPNSPEIEEEVDLPAEPEAKIELLSSAGWRSEELFLFCPRGKAQGPWGLATARLLPGESAMLVLGRVNRGDRRIVYDTAMKVRIAWRRGGQSEGWQGAVETPAYPMRMARWPDLSGVPLPEHCYLLGARGFMGANMSGGESLGRQMAIWNGDLTWQLYRYPRQEATGHLRKQFAGETNLHLKTVLASMLAGEGCPEAREFLEGYRFQRDYEVYRSMLDGLGRYDDWVETPEWVLRAVLAGVGDKRRVPEESEPESRPGGEEDGDVRTVGQMSREWADGILAVMKARGKVPPGIRYDGPADEGTLRTMALEAMKQTPDEREVLRLLKEHAGRKRPPGHRGMSREFDALAEVAAQRHYTAALPILLEHVQEGGFWDLITLGDPRAAPAMREIVAAGGRCQGARTDESDEDRRKRLEWARLALAVLEEGDPVPRLGALLLDTSVDEYMRRLAIRRLEGRREERLVSYLVRSVREEPSSQVIGESMRLLAEFRNQVAFDTLVGCIESHPGTRGHGKGNSLSEESYHDSAADRLREMTGVNLGADAAAWRRWWSSGGRPQPAATRPSDSSHK